ncbi:DUF4328 domain-containing protein [Leptospira koniambonensis]
MEQMKPNGKRANIALILILILLVLEVVLLVLWYLQYDLIQTAMNGEEISSEVAETSDSIINIISILYMILFIVSAATFLRWFVRAYQNLELFSEDLIYNQKQALWAWFIPILNLLRPYEIMKELYTETRKLLVKYEPSNSEKIATTDYLSPWWGLWVISNIIGQILLRFPFKVETMEGLNTFILVNIIAHLIAIPLCIIAAKVIKDYSYMETLLEKVKITDITNS